MSKKKDQRKRILALLEILKPDELRELEVLMEAIIRGVAVDWSKLEQRAKGDKLTVADMVRFVAECALRDVATKGE